MTNEGDGHQDIRSTVGGQRADTPAATEEALRVTTERFEAAIQASHVVWCSTRTGSFAIRGS